MCLGMVAFGDIESIGCIGCIGRSVPKLVYAGQWMAIGWVHWKTGLLR